MRPGKLLVLSLGLVGLLAACSSAPKNTQAMTQAEAKATADVALSDLALSGALIGDPYGLTAQNAQKLGMPVVAAGVLEGLGMDLTQAISAQCKIDIGSWVDKDLDGIPAGFSIQVSNCSYSDGTFTYSFQGSLNIDDTNDNLKNSGFKLGLNNFIEEATKGSDSYKRTFDGNYTLDTQNASLFKADKGYTASQTYTLSGQTDSASAQYGVSETYAPDDAIKPKVSGTFTIPELSPGTLTVTHNGKTYTWKWNTKPTLHYVASCKARTPNRIKIPFDKGGAFYSYTNPDGSVATLEIQFTGCNAYTILYNNSPVTP